MMLNPFMILAKQLEVVLTHFRWKILFFVSRNAKLDIIIDLRRHLSYSTTLGGGGLTHQKTFGALILVIRMFYYEIMLLKLVKE